MRKKKQIKKYLVSQDLEKKNFFQKCLNKSQNSEKISQYYILQHYYISNKSFLMTL